MRVFNPNEVAKIQNKSGFYTLYDRNKKPIYYGTSKVIKHRLQSFYQRDDFKVNKTKKVLRGKIKYFEVRYLPIEKARKLERKSLINNPPKYNYRLPQGNKQIKKVRSMKKKRESKARYRGKDYDLNKIPIWELNQGPHLKHDLSPRDISIAVGVIILIIAIWGMYKYGD